MQIIQDTILHTANVAVHVVFGTLALALGVIQLARRKGDWRHRRYGRAFLTALWVTVGTAAAGIIVFRFRAFLGVITLLAAYQGFSGLRALRIRSTGPSALDAVGAFSALGAAVVFVLYLRSVELPWAPGVIYSTLGALVTVALYDLSRFAFPKQWFSTLWLYEHLVKMIGAFNASLSAFAGTVLSAWQPYSQLVPSMLCRVVMIGFLLHIRRRREVWFGPVAAEGSASGRVRTPA